MKTLFCIIFCFIFWNSTVQSQSNFYLLGGLTGKLSVAKASDIFKFKPSNNLEIGNGSGINLGILFFKKDSKLYMYFKSGYTYYPKLTIDSVKDNWHQSYVSRHHSVPLIFGAFYQLLNSKNISLMPLVEVGYENYWKSAYFNNEENTIHSTYMPFTYAFGAYLSFNDHEPLFSLSYQISGKYRFYQFMVIGPIYNFK